MLLHGLTQAPSIGRLERSSTSSGRRRHAAKHWRSRFRMTPDLGNYSVKDPICCEGSCVQIPRRFPEAAAASIQTFSLWLPHLPGAIRFSKPAMSGYQLVERCSIRRCGGGGCFGGEITLQEATADQSSCTTRWRIQGRRSWGPWMGSPTTGPSFSPRWRSSEINGLGLSGSPGAGRDSSKNPSSAKVG